MAISADLPALRHGCFNKVIGVIVPTVALCDFTVRRTTKMVHHDATLYRVARTMPFGLDVTSSHFRIWEEIDSEDQAGARARLASFLLLIDAKVPHSCA